MITEKELKMVRVIAESEYADQVGDPVWVDTLEGGELTGRTVSGLVSSLSQKGFIATDGECVWLTETGVEMYQKVIHPETNFLNRSSE